jgi:ribonuclease HIII
MSAPVFVTTLDLAIAEKLRNDLIERDFDITTPPHTIFSARKSGISCTLYQSGKLTVQGKESQEFIEFYLEPEILGAVPFTHAATSLDLTPRIGIDESGKGDFFGPLCIAGVYAGGDQIEMLKKLGVKDSKTISDTSILKLAQKIRANFDYHVVRINPLKYNELYAQFKNLNHLLAWGHATTIEQLILKTGCRQVIIDQFAAEHVVENALARKKLVANLSQRHRGEEDVVVAAASILARAAFLNGLEQLGSDLGMKLPKGASAATKEAGRTIVRQFGAEALTKVSKVHFKTYQMIVNG